jgi:(E)-4-hydroxy-3-methylbut-2-enyl-diphosphate synthase
LRNFGPEIISCPTCGRCQVNLEKIVKETNHMVQGAGYKKQIKIAIMGCEVNGPGEAKEADIGIACGKGSGVIFKKGKIVKRVKEKDIVKELLRGL